MKPEWWGSPLVQEKYREEIPVTGDIHIYNNNNNNNIIIIITIYRNWLSPGGSGYFTFIPNMKFVTNTFMSGGLHEKHVVTTWNVRNRLSICL